MEIIIVIVGLACATYLVASIISRHIPSEEDIGDLM